MTNKKVSHQVEQINSKLFAANNINSLSPKQEDPKTINNDDIDVY